MSLKAPRTVREQQRDLLNDPMEFVQDAWSDLIGCGSLDSIFMGDAPRPMWNNRDEAFRLIRLAAVTPGADVSRYVGEAQDASNNLATHQYHLGLELGAVLEQLRQGLIACLASMETPHAHDASDKTHLAKLRAELEGGCAAADAA